MKIIQIALVAVLLHLNTARAQQVDVGKAIDEMMSLTATINSAVNAGNMQLACQSLRRQFQVFYRIDPKAPQLTQGEQKRLRELGERVLDLHKFYAQRCY